MNTLTSTFNNMLGRQPALPAAAPAQRRDETLTACRCVVPLAETGLSLRTCRHLAAHVLGELGYQSVAETHDGFGIHGRQQDAIASLIFERVATGSADALRFGALRVQVISRIPGAAASQCQMLQMAIARISA